MAKELQGDLRGKQPTKSLHNKTCLSDTVPLVLIVELLATNRITKQLEVALPNNSEVGWHLTAYTAESWPPAKTSSQLFLKWISSVLSFRPRSARRAWQGRLPRRSVGGFASQAELVQ